MKKRLISAILAIVMLLAISPFVYAETVLLDRSLPQYDEQETFPDHDYYGSYGVRSKTLQGNGAVSYAEKDGNKMIKMSIEKAVTSGYNYAILTMFVNRSHKDYYKNGIIISYDLIAPKNAKIVLHTYGANYPSRRLYSVDNGVLIPAVAGTDVTDTNKQAVLTEGKMYNIKLALDAVQKTYTIFLDGVKVGDTYTFADNYISSSYVGEIPPLYLSLRTNDSTTEYPVECYVDNLKIISYKEDGIEIASDYDISDDNISVEEFNPESDKHSIGLDVFNNNTEASDITLASLKYKANENGFKSLEGYNIKKSVLTPVYNRMELSKMLIPENDEASSSKLLFVNSLYSPDVTGAMYTFTNDGTSVTEVKEAVTAGETPAKGTLEVTNLDREVTVKGHVEDADALPLSKLPVGMVVLNKDKTKDDLNSDVDAVDGESDNISSMVYLDASKTDSEGNYSFKLEMPEDAEMGDYLIISKVGNTEYKTKLRYLTSKQKQDAIKVVNASLDKDLSEFITAIEENEFPLSLLVDYKSTPEMYDEVKTKSTFMDLIRSYGKYSEDFADVADSVNKFNKNLDNAILLRYMESINDSTDQLKAYAEAIAEQTGLIISGITDDNSDFVYTALDAFDDFSSLNKINTHIAENIVIYDILNALNWGSIRSTVETYADYLGLDLEDEDVEYNDVYREMFKVKEKLDNIEDIKETFEDLMEECQIEEDDDKSSSSGRPSGGGGGGGIVATPVVTPSTVVTPPEETVTPVTPEPELPFNDVDANFWGYNNIKELYNLKLINGVSDTEFAPQNNIKREEFVALLVRMAGLENKSEVKFTDVSSEDWFADVLSIAYENGIIGGKTDGSFGAGENITRQDIAVMINNMAAKGIIDITDNGAEMAFSDKDSISDYARASVETAAKAGIITGYTDSTFRPLNNATRAEAATIILRIYNLMQK